MKSEDRQKLKDYLKEFKELTMNLIRALEADEFEELDRILNNRQVIINEISKNEMDSEVFKELSGSLNIIPLEQKLSRLMYEKKQDLKKELCNLEDVKVVSENYSKKFSVDSLYFDKKI